jgi:hypothetical protein
MNNNGANNEQWRVAGSKKTNTAECEIVHDKQDRTVPAVTKETKDNINNQ